jgi:hypothetical protein
MKNRSPFALQGAGGAAEGLPGPNGGQKGRHSESSGGRYPHGYAEKIDGRAVFGIDVRLPGMLNATIVHAPVSARGL